MDSDWDLQAVVRGCCSAVSTTTTTPPLDPYTQQNSTSYEQNYMNFFLDLCQPTSDNSIEQLLYNHYHPLHFANIHKPPSSPQSIPVSPLSVLGGLQDPPHHHQQQYEKQAMGKQQSFGITRCTTTHAQSTTKFKKRKNQIKKVCHVPAEGPSSDLWSWRKYGQKPIKGSPYPRGYYKCSTSKGCSARKQVERNRSDPGMLIITYTGEHSHPMPSQRNTLAGNSRNKTITSGDNVTGENSPAKEKLEENDTGVVIDEDSILDGLDELAGPATGDIFSDPHAGPITSETRVDF